MSSKDMFNALPYEVRKICCAQDMRTRIQHLTFEKRRLKSAYAKSCTEIDAHMRNLQSALDKLEMELLSDKPESNLPKG